MAKCKFPGCITEIAPRYFINKKEDIYPQFCFLHSRILAQNDVKYNPRTGKFYQWYYIHNPKSNKNRKVKKIFSDVEVKNFKEMVKKNDFVVYDRLNEKVLINA